MSRIRTNVITNRMANGAPTDSNGLVISGVTTTSDVNVGAGVTLNVYGGATFSGIVTATSFVGDGSGLTGAGPSLANGADNRVVTSSSATALNGEATLTYDGNNLSQSIDAAAEGIQIIGSGAHYGEIKIDSNRTGANQHLGTFKAAWNGTQVSRIAFNSGYDTSNKDDGQILFDTSSSGGTLLNRVRITSGGNVAIGGNASPQQLLHVWPDTANTTSAYVRVTSGDRGSGTGIDLGSDADGDGRLNVVSNGNLKLYTNNTERLRIDSSGRVLIGTTTGDPYGNRQLTVNSTSGTTAIEVRSATNGDGRIYFTDSTASGSGAYMGSVQYDHTNNFMKFETNGGSEKMRIHSGGQVTIGHTSSTEPTTNGILLAPNATSGFYTANNYTLAVGRGSSDGKAIQFNRSGTNCGHISVTSSSTSYNSGSDYRLKENVAAISDGITRIKTLKPSRFNFKVDTDTTVDGFLAHEVTAVPEAITGTKDEVETIYYKEGDTIPDGKVVGDVKDAASPVYQGIDQSKLVPLLTAALQEAISKIETLETKVAALEAG